MDLNTYDKIKTEFIPSIHNTISLEAYLLTEHNEPLANQEIHFNFLKSDNSLMHSFARKTNAEGKYNITINDSDNLKCEIIYNGNKKYGPSKVLYEKGKSPKEIRTASENNKIQTRIISNIHQTVSLQAYLLSEYGKPLINQDVYFDLYDTDDVVIYSYGRKTNNEGKCNITLNATQDLKIETVFEGNSQYKPSKITTTLNKPRPKKEIKAEEKPQESEIRKSDAKIEETQESKKQIKEEKTKEETKPEKKTKEIKEETKPEKKAKKTKEEIKEEKKLKKIEEYYEKQNLYELDYPYNVAIELRNVSLSFKITNDKIDNLKEYVIRTLNRTKAKKTDFKATDNVSFVIFKGEKVGIIGYNGAGKSTLLKIISGVYTPDEGKVIINGNIAPLLSLGAGFDKNYSGRENIFLNGAILGYDEEFLREKYDEILEFSELGEFINVAVKNYSSGMLSKLGFSIATIVEPDILILDEVLGVGDINFRKKSKEKLQSLMESNTTVLLVSHSISEIRSICDKAIWIENGRVREIGEVNYICDKYTEEAKNASKEKTKKLKPKRF